MTDHLKSLFEHLREAEQQLADQEPSLEQARAQRQAASEALWQAIEQELDATVEWSDLKESVARLEGLVLEQGAELRRLRERLNGEEHR